MFLFSQSRFHLVDVPLSWDTGDVSMLLFREIDLRGGFSWRPAIGHWFIVFQWWWCWFIARFIELIWHMFEHVTNRLPMVRGGCSSSSLFCFIQEKWVNSIDLHSIGAYEGLDDSVYTCFLTCLNTVNSSKQNDQKRWARTFLRKYNDWI